MFVFIAPELYTYILYTYILYVRIYIIYIILYTYILLYSEKFQKTIEINNTIKAIHIHITHVTVSMYCAK